MFRVEYNQDIIIDTSLMWETSFWRKSVLSHPSRLSEFGRFGFTCRGIVWGLVSGGFSRDQELKLINCLLVIKMSRQRLLWVLGEAWENSYQHLSLYIRCTHQPQFTAKYQYLLFFGNCLNNNVFESLENIHIMFLFVVPHLAFQ